MTRNVIDEAREALLAAIASACVTSLQAEIPDDAMATLRKCTQRPRGRGQGELAFPCASLCKLVGGRPPAQIATELASLLSERITSPDDALSTIFESIVVQGPTLNVTLRTAFFASVVHAINHEGYLDAQPVGNKEKVMIEYSQPNTHKAFHVGHMRNVALGDSLVRLWEHMGHKVVAANYFGDEGAHVAKCLWLLKQRMDERGCDLDGLNVPDDRKGEYLGLLYAEANDMLDLSQLTKYPYDGVVAARVVSIDAHPAPNAPKNWHVCQVEYGEGRTATVVCGGTGYTVGDMVAYIPVGTRFKKQTVATKDMMGVESSGIMLAYAELGAQPPKSANATPEAGLSNKQKKKAAQGASQGGDAKAIMLIAEECSPGDALIEIGKLDKKHPGSVQEAYKKQKKEVGDVLLKLESGDPEWCALWAATKKWSLDEFKSIYAWLDARFDHDFFESEVSEDSKAMVMENYQLGKEGGSVMVETNGAIGCDLSMCKPPLPFLVLIKSNGAGLYATKDLALARRKFDEFHIDRSIYVVDAAQSCHFQQVFACLDRMGYPQAKKCFHLAYGQVVGEHGKMSSRDGTVIYFSELRKQLADEIMESYLKKYKDGFFLQAKKDGSTVEKECEIWSSDEIESVKHAISVATIKYRMLNQDPIKDITFILKDWTAKTGDTGPYMCYVYARIKQILAKVGTPSDGRVDLGLLGTEYDRALLYSLNSFWATVEKAAYDYKPFVLCKFLFDLSKDFNAWYERSPVMDAPTADLRVTRVEFIVAVGAVIKTGLSLLGIRTVNRM